MLLNGNPEAFPLLFATAREQSDKRAATTAEALSELADGVARGQIRKVVFDEVKHYLGRALEKAYEKHVSGRFSHGGKWEQLAEADRELLFAIRLSGLSDIAASIKKAERSRATGECALAIREFLGEVQPLGEAVVYLRDKVVKGRAPPSDKPSQPENPNKIVKTCACCFRSIAIAGAGMAHHGYQRPGPREQTASCPGIRFPPLEVSNAGLVWLIGTVRTELDRLRNALATKDQVQSLQHKDFTTRQWISVKREDALWPRVYRGWVSGLETNERFATQDLASLERRLAEWVPEATDAAKPDAADESPEP